MATLIIWCIPGIFGFLVWELKENWRLYAANRPQGLQPMIIGQPRRNDGPAAEARLPFRHDSQTLRQTPPRRTKGPEVRATGRRCENISTDSSTSRSRSAATWSAISSRSQRKPPRRGNACAAAVIAAASQEFEFGTNRVRLGFFHGRRPNSASAIDFEVQAGWLLGGVGQARKCSSCRQATARNYRRRFSASIKRPGRRLFASSSKSCCPALSRLRFFGSKAEGLAREFL